MGLAHATAQLKCQHQDKISVLGRVEVLFTGHAKQESQCVGSGENSSRRLQLVIKVKTSMEPSNSCDTFSHYCGDSSVSIKGNAHRSTSETTNQISKRRLLNLLLPRLARDKFFVEVEIGNANGKRACQSTRLADDVPDVQYLISSTLAISTSGIPHVPRLYTRLECS